MAPLNVLITQPFAGHLLDLLREVSPDLRVSLARPDEADYRAVDVLYCMQPPKDLSQAPRLKWVQMHNAGVNQIVNHPLFQRTDIIITSNSGVHASAVAEFAFTMLLTLAHQVPGLIENQRGGAWPTAEARRQLTAHEVRGATVGILGYGSIGRELARLLQPFQPRIVVTKRNIDQHMDEGYTRIAMGDPEGLFPDEWLPLERLHDLMAVSDYVLDCLPLTPETVKLVDAAAIAAMKPAAYLINIGRGGTIDEAALVQALQERRIGGAALDVYDPEPLPAGSPLWGLDNVIVSPHVSGYLPGFNERATELFSLNLYRYLHNEPLLNLVDRSKGY